MHRRAEQGGAGGVGQAHGPDLAGLGCAGVGCAAQGEGLGVGRQRRVQAHAERCAGGVDDHDAGAFGHRRVRAASPQRRAQAAGQAGRQRIGIAHDRDREACVRDRGRAGAVHQRHPPSLAHHDGSERGAHGGGMHDHVRVVQGHRTVGAWHHRAADREGI